MAKRGHCDCLIMAYSMTPFPSRIESLQSIWLCSLQVGCSAQSLSISLVGGAVQILLNKSDSYVNKLDKLQNKLLKAAIGIPKFCRSTPVIYGIDVPTASNIIKCSQIFNNNSASRTFYSHLLNSYFNNEISSIKGTLVSRVIKTTFRL